MLFDTCLAENPRVFFPKMTTMPTTVTMRTTTTAMAWVRWLCSTDLVGWKRMDMCLQYSATGADFITTVCAVLSAAVAVRISKIGLTVLGDWVWKLVFCWLVGSLGFFAAVLHRLGVSEDLKSSCADIKGAGRDVTRWVRSRLKGVIERLHDGMDGIWAWTVGFFDHLLPGTAHAVFPPIWVSMPTYCNGWQPQDEGEEKLELQNV